MGGGTAGASAAVVAVAGDPHTHVGLGDGGRQGRAGEGDLDVVEALHIAAVPTDDVGHAFNSYASPSPAID